MIRSIPETNLVFIRITQYQKDGNVGYCGALTDSCKDVRTPTSRIENDDDITSNCTGAGSTDATPLWLTEALRIQAPAVCRQVPAWTVSTSALTDASGEECPTDNRWALIITTVVAPLAACICLSLFYWCWQRSHNQYIGIQGSCFPQAKTRHDKVD